MTLDNQKNMVEPTLIPQILEDWGTVLDTRQQAALKRQLLNLILPSADVCQLEKKTNRLVA